MANLTDLGNRLRDLFNQGVNTVGNVGKQAYTNVIAPTVFHTPPPPAARGLTPIRTAIQNFGQAFPILSQNIINTQPFFDRLGQAAQNPPMISVPKFNETQVRNPVGRTVANLPSTIAEGLVNIPALITKGSTRTGFNLAASNRGEQVGIKKYLGDAAYAGEGILNAAGIGGASSLAKEGAKATLKQAILDGIYQGSKYGAAYGITQGLQQYANEKNMSPYVIGIGKKIIEGMASGAILGGGIGGISHITDNVLSGLNPKQTEELVTYIRNRQGQFAKNDIKGQWMSDVVGKSPSIQEAQSGFKVPDYINNDFKTADQILKEKYGLMSPKQFEKRQAAAENSVKANENLNLQSGLPPEGLPPSPGFRRDSILSKLGGLKDQLITESRQILNNMGQAGQEAAKRIDNVYNNSERMTGGLVADFKQATKGLSDIQLENINKALDGQQVKLTPQEANVAGILRQKLNGVADLSAQSGVEIKLPDGNKIPFAPRQDYLPHLVDINKLKENSDLTIKHLVDTGQLDPSSAKAFVQDIISGTPIQEAYSRYFGQHIPDRFGNLEFARIIDWPKQVLRYDKQLLPDYFANAANRINQVQNFGPNNEILNNLLDNIARSGYDSKTADEILAKNLGMSRGNAVDQGVGAIKQLQATTKLGLGAITNAGQSVNTATSFGIVPTIKNMFSAFSPESQDFALRSGAVVDSALNDIKNEVQGQGMLSKITAPGFAAVEKFNRVVAANTGKDFATSRFQSLLNGDRSAIADLEKLGVNVQEALSSGQLSQEDLLKAGQKAVNITQFKTRPIDLPPTWSTNPVVRLMTQFKSFAYKHGQFIKDEVLKPALQGNIAPLTRWTILSLVVGEGISDVKAFVRNRQRETSPVTRAFDNFTSVGGLGLVQDAISAAQRGPEAVLSFISGPTLGDMGKVIGGTGLALQGKPKTLARFALGNIPIVGQPIANTVFPPQGAYRSRTPDIIQEGIGIQQTGDLTQDPNVLAMAQKDKTNLTPYEAAQIKDQISKLDQKEKDILANNGINIPLIGQIGGLTVDQKNQQLTELNKVKKLLNMANDKPTVQKDAEYALTTDRLKRNNDYTGWVDTTNKYIDFLQNYQNSLDPQTDNVEILKTQNKIEDLKAQVDKYTSYGGFTKGKKSSKISIATSRVSTPKPLKIKLSKAPRLKISKNTIKLTNAKQPKLNTFKIAKTKLRFSSKPSLTG